LVIEIDGDSHFTPEGKRYDEMRTSILQSYGLRVIQNTNEDVLKNFSAVCDMIERIPPTPLAIGGKGGSDPDLP
jgi:very-short-patch-repair endonuclease